MTRAPRLEATTTDRSGSGAAVRYGTRLGKGAEAPSPPNRTCGSPASGSPVGCFLIGDTLPPSGLRSW